MKIRELSNLSKLCLWRFHPAEFNLKFCFQDGEDNPTVARKPFSLPSDHTGSCPMTVVSLTPTRYPKLTLVEDPSRGFQSLEFRLGSAAAARRSRRNRMDLEDLANAIRWPATPEVMAP